MTIIQEQNFLCDNFYVWDLTIIWELIAPDSRQFHLNPSGTMHNIYFNILKWVYWSPTSSGNIFAEYKFMNSLLITYMLFINPNVWLGLQQYRLYRLNELLGRNNNNKKGQVLRKTTHRQATSNVHRLEFANAQQNDVNNSKDDTGS